MKAILPNGGITTKNEAESTPMLRGFSKILNIIADCRDRAELKQQLAIQWGTECGEVSYTHHVSEYFIYGFGGSHFWCKQKEHPDKDLILVYFD